MLQSGWIDKDPESIDSCPSLVIGAELGEEDECELCVVDVLVAGEGFEPPTFGL